MPVEKSVLKLITFANEVGEEVEGPGENSGHLPCYGVLAGGRALGNHNRGWGPRTRVGVERTNPGEGISPVMNCGGEEWKFVHIAVRPSHRKIGLGSQEHAIPNPNTMGQ